MPLLAHGPACAVPPDADGVDVILEHDPDRWPWHALPPQHPVLLVKYKYHASVTALWALDFFEPGVFSALTHFEWRCPPASPASGYPTRARCEAALREGVAAFDLRIDAADGAPLMISRGAGVAFPNRDYEGWRAHTKQKTKAAWAALDAPSPTAFATPQAAGVAADVPVFITPPRGAIFDALVTREGGFCPGHPYHTGSGDHVNAAHLFDCVFQAAHVLMQAERGDRVLRCVSGRAEFTRYVELDVPFSLTVEAHAPTADGASIAFAIRQLDRPNARIECVVEC